MSTVIYPPISDSISLGFLHTIPFLALSSIRLRIRTYLEPRFLTKGEEGKRQNRKMYEYFLRIWYVSI